MLVKYLGGSVKDDWAKKAAKRAARLAQETAEPSLLESIQGGKKRGKIRNIQRRKANEKVQKLLEAYC